MPRLLIDVRPLRASADYRRLWIGSGLSQLGGQMTTYAVALQVFTLTHSSAAVGGVGLVAAVPAITAGLLGGPLVDAVDRRKVVLVASCLQAGVSVLLAAQAFAGLHSVALLYALVAVQYLIASINGPARRTFIPRLLPRELLPAGAALTMLAMHLSLISGPSLAGVITAAGGLRFCYLIDAVSFTAALYGVLRLPPMPPDGAPAKIGVRAVGEGLRFIVHRKVVLGALLADLSATALGMPFALFPAINADRFGGAPQTLGLLTAAVAAGGILGTALSGPISHVSRPGIALLVCAGGWGAGLIGFGLVRSLVATLACLVVAGIADVFTVVFRSTVLQAATPDRLRGRTASAEFVSGAASPQLGNFRAGVLGSLTTPGTSAVIGGVSTLIGAAAIGLALPAFRRYRLDDPEPAEDLEPAPGQVP